MKYKGHISVMKTMLYDDDFADLSLKAIICICLLYDRFRLSTATGYVDREGKTCVVFPQDKLKRPLRCGVKTVGKVLKELEDNEFIIRYHQCLTRADIIYVTEKLCKIFTPEEEDFTYLDKMNCPINNIYKSNNNNESIDQDQIFMLLNAKWDFSLISSKSERHEEIAGLLFDVVIDIFTSDRKKIYIAGELRNTEEVKTIVARLTELHIINIVNRVVDHMDEIDDLTAYIKTALYNSAEKIPVKRS